jgi:hypothetical protein
MPQDFHGHLNCRRGRAPKWTPDSACFPELLAFELISLSEAIRSGVSMISKSLRKDCSTNLRRADSA